SIEIGAGTYPSLDVGTTAQYDIVGDITITGDLTISGGTMVLSNNTLTITGNFVNNGSFGVAGGTGTVNFAGTNGVQTIGGSQQTLFEHVTVNNPSGVMLTHDEIVGGVLALTAGDLDTGPYTLTNGGNSPSTGTHDVIGSVKRTVFGGLLPVTFGNP